MYWFYNDVCRYFFVSICTPLLIIINNTVVIFVLMYTGDVAESKTIASLGHEGNGTGYTGIAVPTQPQRRGALQLWQFLVTLLDDPNNASCIVWTGRGMEFKLVEPEEVSTIK